MKNECGQYQFAITDFVYDQATYNNTETKAGKTSSTDGSELSTREAEVSAPVGENATTDTESDASCKDGKKSGP